MADNNNKKGTYGTYDFTGRITVVDDTFALNIVSKNNANYLYSRLNIKMEDDKGGSLYYNIMDGFDKVKGKTIKAKIKDSKDKMDVAFVDRGNDIILEKLDDNAFIRIGLRKVPKKNEETGKEYMEWEYKKFLTTYDAIAFLKEVLKTNMKVHITGNTSYNLFNEKVNKNFNLSSIYILPEDDKSEMGFKFRQDVLLVNDSLDKSEWETNGIIKVNSKIYHKKNKETYEVLPLSMIIRSTSDKKESFDRMINKFLTVEEDKVRRIKLDGKYNIGYIASEVTEGDLPPEAVELIEDGFYSKEEVLKMYANRERVDEMILIRPAIIKDKDSQKPKVDYDDDSYTLEDLQNLEVVVAQEEEIVVSDEQIEEDLEFLNDLD